MATPVGYIEQFIPTDIGVLERGLAATQMRADSAYQGLLQADSQFANVLATNQDAELKNQLLGEFRSNTEKILKKYGMDYAPASKELAREVVNTGNNPFWQLNAAKQRGIDTYNQMKVKMGSDAIDGYNPANTPIYNKQSGQYTSPEEFNPTVYSSSTLSEGLKGTFGPRMGALNETLMQNLGPTGVLTATTIRGITEDQVPKLAAEMYSQLKQEAPLANDAQLRAKANDTALSYVQGQIKTFMSDPEYARRAREKELPPAKRNYITTILPGKETGITPNQAKDILKDYDEAVNTPKINIEEPGYTGAMMVGAALYNKNIDTKIQKALKLAKGPQFDELKSKYGKSDREAAEIVLNELSSKLITHDTGFKSADVGANSAFVRDLNSGYRLQNLDNIRVYSSDSNHPEKGSVESREKYETSLKTAISNNEIQDITFDAKGDELYLTAKGNKTYVIPTSVISNTGAMTTINNYSSLFKILQSGKEAISKKAVMIGDQQYVARRRFDPSSNTYINDILTTDSSGNVKSIPEEVVADKFFTDLFSSYGIEDQTKYRPQYIDRLQYLEQ